MKLKKLILTNFGKFQNYTLEVDDGLNLIYGENEAGKSTLQAFIHGMFYGFIKPNVKKTIYLDEFKKYEPFDRQDYRGSIIFEYESGLIRIERTFSKSKEQLRVYNEITGEDITKNLANSGQTRIIQPGFHFFNMDYQTFKNTISIEQNQISVDKKISEELREWLSNKYQTNDENISINRAIKNLEQRKKEIGSIKASTSDYKKIIDKLDVNKKRLKEIEIDKKQYIELITQRLKIKEDLSELNKILDDINNKMIYIKTYERYEKYLKAKELIEKINSITKKTESMANGINISNDDLYRFKNINKNLDNIKEELRIIEREVDYINANLKNVMFNEFRIKEINDELKKLEALLKMNPENNKALINDLEPYTSLKSKVKFINIFMVLLPVFVVFVSINSYYNGNFTSFFAVQLIWVLFYFLQHRKRILNEKANLIDKYNKDKGNYKLLLKELDLKEEGDLRDEINKLNQELSNLNLDKKDIDRMEMRIKELERKRISLQTDYEKQQKELEKELLIFEVDNLENLIKEHEKQKEKETLINELRISKELLKVILESDSFDDLDREFSGITNLDIPLDYENKKDLVLEIEAKEKMIIELEKKLSNIEGSLKTIGNLFEEESFLIEENELLSHKIKEYDLEINAIDMAINKINKISEEIHQNFAPEFNRIIGEKVKYITKGKYSSIKMDKEMGISVLEPKTDILISLDKLSYGTIDQINFALRLALSEEIGAEKFPLIIDEAFVYFDEERLRNTLEILNKISNQRQVIIFTCHDREKRLLDEFKNEINFIQLTDE
ncbi:MAG: AAA family ATPase [Tissierellales bacterium]|nr:AAA family ATPase [Tissierellales bacterium]